jgi:hypothetical protein
MIIKFEKIGIAIIPNTPKSQITKATAATLLNGPGRRSISQIIKRKIKISQRLMDLAPRWTKGNLRAKRGPYPKNQNIIRIKSITVNI